MSRSIGTFTPLPDESPLKLVVFGPASAFPTRKVITTSAKIAPDANLILLIKLLLLSVLRWLCGGREVTPRRPCCDLPHTQRRKSGAKRDIAREEKFCRAEKRDYAAGGAERVFTDTRKPTSRLAA
jgi:hypothetical protein